MVCPSIAHAWLLGIGCQVVGDLTTGLIILAIEGHEVVKSHTAMLADQAEWDLPFFQQSDEVWPRDVEQVGSLLRREFGVDRKRSGCAEI